jgi:hypothetical protein
MLTSTKKVFALIVLGVVLCYSVCGSMPMASAAELSFEVETVSILSDVVGLKTD